MTIALVYDPRGHTWDSWASLMVEAYAGQQLEIPNGEDNWKAWGAILKGIDTFASEGVPSPYLFDKWEDWAESLVNSVNQKV